MGLTLRKYKRELQQKIKILPSGERHKWFDYPVFVEIPKEWEVKPTTPLEVNEVRTAVCYAGDIRRNFVEYYILKKIDWENDRVECTGVEEQGGKNATFVENGSFTFYSDAVALIPYEIIPPRVRLGLLHQDELLSQDREKRANRQKEKQKQEQKIEALADELKNGEKIARRPRGSNSGRSTESATGMEGQQSVDSRPEVDGKKEEDGIITGIETGEC